MRTSGHTVNRRLVPPPPTPEGTFDGVDLALARGRVRAEGGDVAIFTTTLGWAAAALSTPPSREDLLTISACAAWRAGVTAIRSDALRRATSPDAPSAAVAGALLMPTAALPAFLAAQAADPFAWYQPLPDSAIAEIGGFAGLGGPWLRPPTAYGQLQDPRELWVAADDQVFRVRADIFGHRLVPLTDLAPNPLESTPVERRGARLERPAEHSYLLRIVA